MRQFVPQFYGIEEALFKAPVGIVVLSTDGCFVRVNAAYRALTGRDDAWLLGRPLTDVLATRADDVRAHLAAALLRDPSEPDVTWTALHQRHDSAVETDITLHAVRDPEGGVRHVLGYVQAVAAHARAAHALDQTEGMIQRAFARAAVGMAILDAAFRFRQVNPALASMLDRSPEDLVGRPYRDFLHPDERAEFDDRARHLQHGHIDPGQIERRFIDGAGRMVHVRGGGARVAGGGEILYFCVYVNMTEQRDAEAERAQLQEQVLHTERLHTLGQIASGIAHEVNNPVAIAAGGVDLARRHMVAIQAAAESNDLPTLRKHVAKLDASLRYCEEGCARLAKVARKLSAFSALHGGRIESVDVNVLVRRALEVVEHDLRHRAELVVELGDLPPLVAHPARLVQAVTNLLVNAAQAIDGPPAENRVHVLTRALDAEIEIMVCDSGVGMSPVVQERIFEPFYSTRSRTDGGGLGLTVVNDVVRQHRGRLDVTSEPGKGSRFSLYLPLVNGLGSPPGIVPPSTARARVLVVDDEPFLLAIVAEILGAEHDVVTADGGPEALALLGEDTRFDALLCDLMMPGVDGIAVHRFLLEHAPALAARTVFATGGAFTPRTEQYVTSRRMPVLLKPFTAEEVRAALATALAVRASARA